MQNPFRDRDGNGHRPRDDQSWDARDQRYDETPTWAGGDGGRTADRYRDQDREARDRGPDRSMSGARGWGYGQDQRSQYGEGLSTGYTGGRDTWGQSGYGVPTYGGYPRNEYDRAGESRARGGTSSYRPADRSSPQSRGDDYARHAYAPGSQIWEGQGQAYDHHSQQSDFEPDYLHWRNQQLSNFDRDYSEWRNERRQKFSSDFDSWRQNRPRAEAAGESRTPAANPVVGDVSDGGTGDVKKR